MDQESVLPVATLVFGILLGYMLDWHKEKRFETRERKARRVSAQRDTLIEVQDLAWELHRLQTASQWDVNQYQKKTGVWPSTDSDDFTVDRENALAVANTSARFALVQSRVDDDEMKGLMRDFNVASRRMSPAPDPESAKKATNASIQALKRLNQRALELFQDLA